MRARAISARNALLAALFVSTGCGLVAGLGEDRQFVESSDNGGAVNGGTANGGSSGLPGAATTGVGGGGVVANGGSGLLPSPAGGGGLGASGRTDGSTGAGPESAAGAAGADVIEPVGVDGPSCAGMNGDECNGGDCCTSLFVRGGSFPMGRSQEEASSDYYKFGGSDELPEHTVTVSPFALDKYEVTVGRFRRFVDSYVGTPPVMGAGADARDGGWQSAWNRTLAKDHDTLTNGLTCTNGAATWTLAASYKETMPINCLDWYEAFAFCVWDGGRLPTEAEWEFAAAGGKQNRLFPWGQADATYDLAVYDCAGVPPAGQPCVSNDILPVGSKPRGNGRYGQADLAGSMLEITRDSSDSAFYQLTELTGTEDNPVNIDESAGLYSARGGAWVASADELRATFRTQIGWTSRFNGVGVRCARAAP